MSYYRFRGIYGGRSPIEDYNLAAAHSSNRKIQELHTLLEQAILPCTEPVGEEVERCGSCAGCRLRAWADDDLMTLGPAPVMSWTGGI